MNEMAIAEVVIGIFRVLGAFVALALPIMATTLVVDAFRNPKGP